MSINVQKLLNPKTLMAIVPISTALFFILIILFSIYQDSSQNKALLNQIDVIKDKIVQLSHTNSNSDEFKSSLLHISNDLNTIKDQENSSAKSDDIEKVSAQINVIKQNIDELKTLVVDSGNGKAFLDAKVLPFQVISVDVISQQPFISVDYDHHITPLGVGDTIAGWQITEADYVSSQVEFKNNKNQYVKIHL